ncbi:SMI1/KNR4 family protein [Herbidospora galbida]|uniref:SMI1/KNR4 family protein n=1 Tax=Herbidospora galbida TaxID=2575442 RepID=A0A4U3LY82_9ACTN|nr:SMI1/KNR4 family protein [Herbidospora galbida]TKK81151.1 SMI1/KNR4 family protein [Herbidospora galbida]
MSSRYAWSERFPSGHPAVSPLGDLHSPATEAEIRGLEERLGVELPPSYRQFLLFTDGWGSDDDCRLLRVEEIGWLRDVDPSTAESWSAPTTERSVPDSLLAGYWDDGVALLNPRVSTAEGEWEAWYLAPWLPGANRYRSFWDLAMDELRMRYAH